MTADALERILALARSQAFHNHIYLDGHDETGVRDCTHPDCVLVRAGGVERTPDLLQALKEKVEELRARGDGYSALSFEDCAGELHAIVREFEARGAVEPPAQEKQNETETLHADVLLLDGDVAARLRTPVLHTPETPAQEPLQLKRFESTRMVTLFGARLSEWLQHHDDCGQPCSCGLVDALVSGVNDIIADTLRSARPSPPPATPQEWQPINEQTPHYDRVFFWVVPKTADETYLDTSDRPIVSNHKPYRHEGVWGSWGALSKPLYWMPLPAAPHGADTPGQGKV